ncbi:hypothetical protein FHG87_013703 [Trinorchestia longiramus]|nr:hypothetical protein FHG87_013703 [Trinorchestia longiramus]
MDKWFDDDKIDVMKWPSQLSDVNPIENLWRILKINVHKRNPQNIKDLKAFFVEKWSRITPKTEERIRVHLSDQQATEAAERVCDGQWHGYGTVMVEDVMRLAGPGTGREVGVADEGESLWSHRLQDMCDELLAEATSEKMLYEAWASGGGEGLEQTLCRGSGFFSACSAAGDFGPWPGDDDYDDYDDNDDFEYVHDEF